MLERVRSLEDTRAKQIALASQEFSNLAQHSADAQREVISSVETVLKSAAYIRASAGGVGRSCDILRASLPVNLPWIRTLLIVGGDGRVQCSTNNIFVGVDLSDRAYFKKAQETRGFVFSDYLIAKATSPIMMAAYPVSAINADADSIIVAGVNLDWMSKIMSNLGGRPGVSAVLIDSNGTVLAAPADQASMIGRSLDAVPLLSAIAAKAIDSGRGARIAFIRRRRWLETRRQFCAHCRHRIAPDRQHRRDQGFRCHQPRDSHRLSAAGVRLPVRAARRIDRRGEAHHPADRDDGGDGETVRPGRLVGARGAQPPAGGIHPLARAFNAMAAQLGQRERELVATNDRLTVIASIDMLSGLANRRGFQSRLDFEWMKAQQYDSELSLLMIDVDHFKLFNDTYGHPEGDACLSRLGETLAGIAAETMGFAGRYGGEEFCLLLPNTGAGRALEIGEMVRAAVQNLAMPHATSLYQTVTVSVGVACTKPKCHAQRPGDLIEAADAALYAAKHRGRNAVVEHGFVRITDGAMTAMALARHNLGCRSLAKPSTTMNEPTLCSIARGYPAR